MYTPGAITFLSIITHTLVAVASPISKNNTHEEITSGDVLEFLLEANSSQTRIALGGLSNITADTPIETSNGTITFSTLSDRIRSQNSTERIKSLGPELRHTMNRFQTLYHSALPPQKEKRYPREPNIARPPVPDFEPDENAQEGVALVAPAQVAPAQAAPAQAEAVQVAAAPADLRYPALTELIYGLLMTTSAYQVLVTVTGVIGIADTFYEAVFFNAAVILGVVYAFLFGLLPWIYFWARWDAFADPPGVLGVYLLNHSFIRLRQRFVLLPPGGYADEIRRLRGHLQDHGHLHQDRDIKNAQSTTSGSWNSERSPEYRTVNQGFENSALPVEHLLDMGSSTSSWLGIANKLKNTENASLRMTFQKENWPVLDEI